MKASGTVRLHARARSRIRVASLPSISGVTTMESQPISAAATDLESGPQTTQRLVIRINLGPESPPPPPAQRRSSRGVLLLIVGAVAFAAMLSWLAMSMFGDEPTSAPSAVTPASSNPVSKPRTEIPATRSVEVAPSSSTKPAESEAPKQLDPPPVAVNEVLPDVPRSAGQTIRGTIRVSVRVIVGKDGAVLTATADDPGPSRYFERLAIDAVYASGRR
jgi:hypothetical protein